VAAGWARAACIVCVRGGPYTSAKYSYAWAKNTGVEPISNLSRIPPPSRIPVSDRPATPNLATVSSDLCYDSCYVPT